MPTRDTGRAARPRTPRSGSRRAPGGRSAARRGRRARDRASPASAGDALRRRGRRARRRARRGGRAPL